MLFDKPHVRERLCLSLRRPWKALLKRTAIAANAANILAETPAFNYIYVDGDLKLRFRVRALLNRVVQRMHRELLAAERLSLTVSAHLSFSERKHCGKEMRCYCRL